MLLYEIKSEKIYLSFKTIWLTKIGNFRVVGQLVSYLFATSIKNIFLISLDSRKNLLRNNRFRILIILILLNVLVSNSRYLYFNFLF